VATFLKLGTTALVLSLIEDDGFEGVDLAISNPVQAIRLVSYDTTLSTILEMADGTTCTALDIQWELFSLARKYAEDRGLECLGSEVVGRDVLDRWESVLHGLETDPMNVSRQVDWVAKLQLVEGYRDRHGLEWDDHRLAALDLQYHDLRPDRSLFARLDTEHLVSTEDVISAVEAVGFVGGERELGLDRLRPRDRPVAACPYDGSAAWHGRTHRGVAQGERFSGRPLDKVERVGDCRWQNGSRSGVRRLAPVRRRRSKRRHLPPRRAKG
jgi:hypothetical protein